METSYGILIQAAALLQKVTEVSFIKLRMTIFKLYDGLLKFIRLVIVLVVARNECLRKAGRLANDLATIRKARSARLGLILQW